MLTRFLLAIVIGITSFTAASAIGFAAACSLSSVAACTGSGWELVSVLAYAKIGASVLALGLITTVPLRLFNWYRSWHVLPMFLSLAVLVPCLYAWHFQFPRPISLFDLVYPTAGLLMGVVILGIWHKRSNNSFKPKPLRGSA